MSTSKETRREIGMLILGIIVMAVIAFVLAKGEPVGVAAQEPQAAATIKPTPVSTPLLPKAEVDTGKLVTRKSYPLPEALAAAINKLVEQRNLSERQLLNYIADPKIYESEDETVRAAMFDRQAKLFRQLGTSMQRVNDWIMAQRKEFKCDTCEASRDEAGKWTFAEPAQAQGGAK